MVNKSTERRTERYKITNIIPSEIHNMEPKQSLHSIKNCKTSESNDSATRAVRERTSLPLQTSAGVEVGPPNLSHNGISDTQRTANCMFTNIAAPAAEATAPVSLTSEDNVEYLVGDLNDSRVNTQQTEQVSRSISDSNPNSHSADEKSSNTNTESCCCSDTLDLPKTEEYTVSSSASLKEGSLSAAASNSQQNGQVNNAKQCEVSLATNTPTIDTAVPPPVEVGASSHSSPQHRKSNLHQNRGPVRRKRPMPNSKALKFLGVNLEEVHREKALRMLGLREDDMYDSEPFFVSREKQERIRQAFNKRYSRKVLRVTGMTEEQIMRAKALKRLGITEDDVERERVRKLSACGKRNEVDEVQTNCLDSSFRNLHLSVAHDTTSTATKILSFLRVRRSLF